MAFENVIIRVSVVQDVSYVTLSLPSALLLTKDRFFSLISLQINTR